MGAALIVIFFVLHPSAIVRYVDGPPAAPADWHLSVLILQLVALRINKQRSILSSNSPHRPSLRLPRDTLLIRIFSENVIDGHLVDHPDLFSDILRRTPIVI